MSDQRWQRGDGPGQRRLPLKTRAKRWLVDLAVRDPRIRRMALNRIFADYAANDTLCLVPFGDHKVFVDPRDDRVAFTILSGRSWQREHLERAIDIVRQAGRLEADSVFVDVGANIGLITIYAMLSGRFSKAIAIEPDPWNRAILQQNLELNEINDRVLVVAKAVSDRVGEMTLHRDAKNLGAHSLEPGFSMSPVEQTESVSVAPLDAILEEIGVTPTAVGLVKIDVEGHEFAALAGMPGILQARPPLMLEVTFDTSDGGQSDSERLRQSLPGYVHVAEIDRPTADPSVALTDFQASADQHELVIF